MVEDNKQEILDWLKTHRNIGDKRASRVWNFLEHHGKHSDLNTAQSFLKEKLEGEGLVHPTGGRLDTHTHNALRQGFGLDRAETEKPELSGGEGKEGEGEYTTPNPTQGSPVQEPVESGPKKSKKEELEEELLRRQIAKQDEKAKIADKEAKEREKWGRAKWVGRKIKTTAKTAYGIATLGSGWIGFFLFSSLIIWLLDSFYKYIGPIEFSFRLPDLWNVAGWSVFLIIIVFHIVWKLHELDWSELVSFGIVVLTLIFVIFTGTLNWLGAIHLVYIILFWLVVIRNEGDQIKSNVMLSAIIIIDFYRYVILKSFLPMDWVVRIMVVPVLLIGTIAYLGKKFPENRLAQFAFWVMIMVIIALNWQRLVLASTAIIATEEGVNVIGPLEVLKGTWGGVKGFFADIQKGYEAQMEYATGGYYQSRVEENEDPDSKLGVYLENIQAADKEFYENEEIVIWGDLKARTLDEPIKVYMSCDSGNEKGIIKPESLSNKENRYEIDKLEEMGFECRFQSGQLKTGVNTIKVRIEFNFETLAFLKTYFMDIERIRALRKDNIDPLDQYGIKEKKGYGVSTYGPIKLGMGTTDPPIGLGQDIDGYTYLGITVENQWAHGRIKNITEVEIQVPSNLNLESSGKEDLYCREDFKDIGENEEGYRIYKMTETEIKSVKTPITAYKSWRCSIKINKGDIRKILGNTPVSTYYYRAKAGYIYEIEKSIDIFIKSVPGEKTRLKSCTTLCEDSDGCICDIPGCNMPQNSEIGKGYTCTDYPGSKSILRDLEESLEYIKNSKNYIVIAIRINELCLEQRVEEINKTIDSLKASEEEKKAFKNLVEGCRVRSRGFFELSEEAIVKKVNDGVNVFNHIKNDLKIENPQDKETVNKEKDSFIEILDKVKNNFDSIYENGIEVEKRVVYNQTIQNAKNELESMRFD